MSMRFMSVQYRSRRMKNERGVPARAVEVGVATAILIAVMASSLPAQRPDTARVEKLIGCHRFTLGPWSKSSSLGPPSQTEIMRLDSTTIRNGIRGTRAAARVVPVDIFPKTDPRVKWLRPAWWRMIDADSLEIITWSTGTEAESFDGHVAGGELRGVMRRTSDVIPVDPKTGRVVWDAWPWAPATARRVACP